MQEAKDLLKKVLQLKDIDLLVGGGEFRDEIEKYLPSCEPLNEDEIRHIIDLVDLHRDSLKEEGLKEEAKEIIYKFDSILLEKLKNIGR